jgi:hypothetical protein
VTCGRVWVLALAVLAGCTSNEWAGEAPATAYRGDEASDVQAERSVGATGATVAPAPAPPMEPGAGSEFTGGLALKDEAGQGGGAPGPVANPPGGGNGQGGANGQGGQGGANGQGGQGGQAGAEPAPPRTPLLIYTAELHLAVFEVQATQRAVLAIARELGGYLDHQDDTRVTIRVPARRFDDAVDRITRVGDVTHRNIQAQDVSEEYRDLGLRLRNAEVVRDRLEQLLARADKVEDALKVQAELARVTAEIESIKGRLRFLDDRIAYSTVTVYFEPRPAEPLDQPAVYRLPFPWLDELGLPTLLDLGSY